MSKLNIIQPVIVEETTTLTLHQFCEACGAETKIVIEMVEHGLIEPQGAKPESWFFTYRELQRAQAALRLQHDLEVNFPGAALIFDLLEEADSLRKKIALLEHQLKSF